MKIFGFSIHFQRQPGPWARLTVMEESITSHMELLGEIVNRLREVEKKAEATRRKVYRDEEPAGEGQKPDGEQAPLPDFSKVGPGEIVPQDYLQE